MGSNRLFTWHHRVHWFDCRIGDFVLSAPMIEFVRKA